MEIWVYFLAAAWLWGFYKEKLVLTPVFLKSTVAMICLSTWLLYTAVQCLPLPVSLVSMLSPEAAKMHQLAGQSGWIPLSVDLHASIGGWMKGLAYVLVFCLSILLVDTAKRLETLAYTLVLSGLGQAFYGAFMTLSDFSSEASGTYVNRNHFAGYLEMCLSVGIGLMIANLGGTSSRTWRQRVRGLAQLVLSPKLRLRIYLAVMVIALVLTHSRMGNTAFFSSMIAAGIIALLLSKGRVSKPTIILLASLVVIDIFIVGTWFGVEKVVTRLESTSVANDAGRIDVTENALVQWKDYLVTGSGGDSFYTVFPRYRTGDLISFFEHADDDYVELGSEYGIVGIGILGGMAFSSLFAAILAQYRRRNPMMRGMAFSSTMGIIALLIHSSVDFNLHIPANALTFMVILSLGWLSLYLERD